MEKIRKIIKLFLDTEFTYLTPEIMISYCINNKGNIVYLYKFKHYSTSVFLFLSYRTLNPYEIEHLSQCTFDKFKTDWYIIAVYNESDIVKLGFKNTELEPIPLNNNYIMLENLIGGLNSKLTFRSF